MNASDILQAFMSSVAISKEKCTQSREEEESRSMHVTQIPLVRLSQVRVQRNVQEATQGKDRDGDDVDAMLVVVVHANAPW